MAASGHVLDVEMDCSCYIDPLSPPISPLPRSYYRSARRLGYVHTIASRTTYLLWPSVVDDSFARVWFRSPYICVIVAPPPRVSYDLIRVSSAFPRRD
ncbi:hypothetical protein HETIRDRAFT_332184 [Heterobasidion irregulare TC 32-1]|uniref:Uncharacterized protein n=1 Tax=Heterobasidion irregulare (strain TC 32-1) TaxID=747525 RepID=W4JP65_HETIT|nr:uncharacterized protein HETIRDRAFT_332184 [Heterobasidion irregulare TC 32-1]ETW74681.1 hypothetical protein HETIRDRAFT_332184 [Heterobasidion irregulare TC 32-1]